MSQKLENAKSLYLEGIRDGNIEVIKKYTGDRYTQHSTKVADGVEGFLAFFKNFIKNVPNRDIRIIRAIEDGNYVFLHVYQNLNKGGSEWITMDMFDTDDQDKIIEHWDVITRYTAAEQTVSGNDVIFGDFEIQDLDKTEENKALVRSFLVDVFQNKNHGALDKYVSTEQYIQHNPKLASGFESIQKFLATEDFNYNFVFHVMGQGNYVVALSKGTQNGIELCIFDIFRIENGKIVEHWDNIEPIPARDQWVNTGKF